MYSLTGLMVLINFAQNQIWYLIRRLNLICHFHIFIDYQDSPIFGGAPLIIYTNQLFPQHCVLLLKFYWYWICDQVLYLYRTSVQLVHAYNTCCLYIYLYKLSQVSTNNNNTEICLQYGAEFHVLKN